MGILNELAQEIHAVEGVVKRTVEDRMEEVSSLVAQADERKQQGVALAAQKAKELRSDLDKIIAEAEKRVAAHETVAKEAIEDFRKDVKKNAESLFTRIGKKLGSGNKQAWLIVGGVVAFLIGVVVVAALQ